MRAKGRPVWACRGSGPWRTELGGICRRRNAPKMSGGYPSEPEAWNHAITGTPTGTAQYRFLSLINRAPFRFVNRIGYGNVENAMLSKARAGQQTPGHEPDPRLRAPIRLWQTPPAKLRRSDNRKTSHAQVRPSQCGQRNLPCPDCVPEAEPFCPMPDAIDPVWFPLSRDRGPAPYGPMHRPSVG